MVLDYIHQRKFVKNLNISETTRVNQLSEEQVLKIREYIDLIIKLKEILEEIYL